MEGKERGSKKGKKRSKKKISKTGKTREREGVKKRERESERNKRARKVSQIFAVNWHQGSILFVRRYAPHATSILSRFVSNGPPPSL